MPQPRKPTALLELSGRFKKDPQRRVARQFEPIVTEPLGDPPERFQAGSSEWIAWNDIVTTAPKGVFTSADRIAVETAAKLLAELRESQLMHAGKIGHLLHFLSHFGMTPADRSRVQVLKPSLENRFSKIG